MLSKYFITAAISVPIAAAFTTITMAIGVTPSKNADKSLPLPRYAAKLKRTP